MCLLSNVITESKVVVVECLLNINTNGGGITKIWIITDKLLQGKVSTSKVSTFKQHLDITTSFMESSSFLGSAPASIHDFVGFGSGGPLK